MQILRNSLAIALLAIGCILGLQLSCLVAQVGNHANQLAESGVRAIDNLDRTISRANAILAASDPKLADSLANLEKSTAAAAEAAGYLRDILSPRKRSFWRRLLEWAIPRPTVAGK